MYNVFAKEAQEKTCLYQGEECFLENFFGWLVGFWSCLCFFLSHVNHSKCLLMLKC